MFAWAEFQYYSSKEHIFTDSPKTCSLMKTWRFLFEERAVMNRFIHIDVKIIPSILFQFSTWSSAESKLVAHQILPKHVYKKAWSLIEWNSSENGIGVKAAWLHKLLFVLINFVPPSLIHDSTTKDKWNKTKPRLYVCHQTDVPSTCVPFTKLNK